MSYSKEALREKALARRKAVSPQDYAVWSEQIRRNFISRVPLPEAGKCIAAYSAINNEVNVTDLYRDLLQKGYVGTMPYADDKENRLRFLEWDGVEKLDTSIYGIAEPNPRRHQENVPDFLIMPLVGFDERGYRIGYGSGNYDRTFNTFLKKINPNFVKVGVAFDAQKLDMDVPAETHDVSLDMLVTETTFYDFRNGVKEKIA